jgi:hypothetical protein
MSTGLSNSETSSGGNTTVSTPYQIDQRAFRSNVSSFLAVNSEKTLIKFERFTL